MGRRLLEAGEPLFGIWKLSRSCAFLSWGQVEVVVALVEETMMRQREAKQHLGLWLLLLMIDWKLTCLLLAPTEKDATFSPVCL